MKTFTTYAEKKAKQILNLLQGYTKGIRLTAILILLLMGVGNAWAYTAHFSLMGDPVGNWNNDRDFMINTSTGTTDEWYIYAYVANNQYFALNNGSDQYGPSSNGKGIKQNTGGGQGNYNKNSWKFTGNSGIIKICCAESQNREWYPYVWVEESAPTIKFKHPWNGGSSWSEQTATKQNDGTYTYDGKYGNKNAFNAGPSGKYKYNESQTTVEGSPATGDMCRFIWNPVGYVQGGAETKASGTFKIVKLCSLTYDGNGKTGGTVPSATNNQLYNTSITLSSETLTKAGYTHTGWNTKADGSGDHYDKGASYTLTEVSTTLYAQWTAKDITINWNANGGSVTPASSTYTYDGDAVELPTPSYAGHSFLGWYTAADGGTQITNVGTTNKPYEEVTYYAHWEVSIVEYKVTFGVGTGSTSYGTLTAATSSGNISSGANIVEGTSVTFTATPNTGYEVEGWYTNAACTADKHGAGQTTYTTSITGITNVYVKFVEKTWSVAFTAGTGGSVTTPSSTPQTVGEVQGITIIAETKEGYTFDGWTSSNGGKFDDARAEKTTFYPTEATTVTANFQEIKHTVQVSVAAGQDTWGSVSPNSVSVGQHTASGNITATAQTSVGYVFDHWELSDGVTIQTGSETDATISITATKDGSLTAHFRGENRMQDVYLIGTMNDWKTSDTDWQFYKLPGESGNTVTLTKTINKSDYHDAGYEFGINIYHSDWDDKYWKNSSSEDTKMTAHNCTGWKFGTKDGDKRTYIDLSVSGEYTFTLAHSGTYNEQALSITYPDKSFIEGDFATAWNEEAYPLVEDGDIQTVTIPITSKKDVEFRLVSHGKVFGTSTKLLIASNSQTLSKKNMKDDGAVMTIGAYVEGDYTFSYNKSTNILTVTWPVINQLQVYRANPEHTEATKNWNWDTHNGDVYSKTLSLNANTKYEFKAVLNSDFYGKTTTLTRETPSVTLNTSGGDVTLQTDIAGDYTFTFNSSDKKLDITYPTAYKVTYTSTYTGGTVSATAESNTLHLPNTEITFTATPKTGYTFQGWKDGNGTQLSTDNPYTHKMTKDITINAVFEENTYNIAIVADPAEAAETLTSSPQSVGVEEVNISTTAKFTYKFDKWTATGGITITDASNPSTSITATEAGTVTAHFTKMQPTTVYLKPNTEWKQSDARFAIHYWHDGQPAGWVDMTDVGCNRDYFVGSVPAGYTQFKFVRMNPETNDNNWDNDWNETGTLNIPTDDKNLFTLPASGDHIWNNATETWSAYSPTYDVTINITGKGSIVINGQTYEGTTEETTTLTIEDIVVNQALTVTAITPADRWDYEGDATITIGSNEQEPLTVDNSYEICGPTTINATFTQTSCEVIFNLNLDKGMTYTDRIDNQYIVSGGIAAEPIMKEIDGYFFGGWYTSGEYTDATKYDFSTPVTQDITLYARWARNEQCIFFKNNLNWDNIYVYTFSDDVWHKGDDHNNPNDDKGVQPKANRIEYGKMTQIGYTDVYYYILTKSDGFNYIAFSDNNMSDYNEFYGNNAIYRGDRNDNMQLFIPQRDQDSETHNNTKYYSKGIWMKYNSTESGYKWSSYKNGWSTDINPFTAPNKGGYSFTTKVSLEGGQEYLFKINNIKKDWFGHTGTMTQDDCTDWWFKTEEDNATIQPNATGEYLFTIYLGDGKVMVSLEYPLGIGDYRLAYKDNTANSFHPGHYIRKRSTTGPHRDTTSFFIFHDKTPIILLQQCTKIEPETGEVTWRTLKGYACTGNNTTDDNPNNAMLPGKKNADGELLISGSSCGVDQTTVYNFVLLQEDGNDANLATSETHLYTGDFYIRTDAAPGGWDYFRQADNLMTFSSYAQQHEHFDHYFCKWIHKDKNVRYTVANDYSYCISDTLFADDIIGGNDGTIEVLPVNANVRFMWDSRDNSIGRAYIAGSSDQADRFLVVEGKDNNLKDAAGNDLLEGQHDTNRYGLEANEEILKDMGNWIYQVDVKANKDAFIKLTAKYNEKIQYFKGAAEGENEYIPLLASDATDTYKIRLIYDFKVNQLIIAWLVDNEDIEENMVLGADMMIIRHNQGRATQINFNNATDTIKNVEKAYAVMTFDKYFLNNLILNDPKNTLLPENERLSQYARALYWISFPFDVRLSDVSGFGEYGDYWILEYYDGADRAKNGLWADTDTYWKYITNPNYIIQAGQGYVLSLNLNKMGSASTVWANTAEVSLFFPSTGSLNTITGELPTAVDVPAYECTIERENGIHKIYDSHWNMIGVPGFADIENVPVGDNLFNEERKLIEQEEVTFYYQYVPEDNTYDAKSKNSENFQIMYSYMVQYCGTINWTTPAFSVPSAIAARSASSMPSEYNMLLELASSNNTADQTYIKLQEERATVDFDLNLDLTKIMNHGENIYTLTGSQDIKCAGNTLPIQRITVPVGVRVDVAGEYTFRMPDGTDGISAILVDNQTGAHTNMLYDEYTVTLDAGTYENRFSLSVDPNRSATSVENIFGDDNEENGDKATGVKKFIIDGQLFIRTTNGLFDAKGQRL